MEIINNTAFPCIGWPSVDADDKNYVTILSRVKFLFDRLDEEGLWSLKFDPDQENFFAADVFYEDRPKEVRFESDFVPYKKQADLIVNLAKTKSEYGQFGVEVLRHESVLHEKSTIQKSLLKHMALNHLGFIHRADASRLQWTGTTDKKWIENRAPKYPKDFNEKHYNAAHPDMQLRHGYFEAGDMVVFHKYLPGQHQQIVMLPGVYVQATVHAGVETQTVLLEADTVLFDIESLDMKENSFYVSYRQRVPVHVKVQKVTFDMQLEEALIEKRSA